MFSLDNCYIVYNRTVLKNQPKKKSEEQKC